MVQFAMSQHIKFWWKKQSNNLVMYTRKQSTLYSEGCWVWISFQSCSHFSNPRLYIAKPFSIPLVQLLCFFDLLSHHKNGRASKVWTPSIFNHKTRVLVLITGHIFSNLNGFGSPFDSPSMNKEISVWEPYKF